MRDDIQWFGKSPDNLPGIQEMVEGSSPDAYLENLEKAGFDTAVERYREEEARRSAIDKTGYPPLVDEQREVWRSWYERTTTLKEYGGSIPSEIAVELARISHEEVFSSLSLLGGV